MEAEIDSETLQLATKAGRRNVSNMHVILIIDVGHRFHCTPYSYCMLKYFINDVAQTVRSDWTPILMAEEQRFNSWQGQTFHLFSTVSRPALGPNTVVSLADSKAAGARS